MNNAIYRSGHLQNVITIDQNMLERVEVLYGPGSTLYGSDALGGVINIVQAAPSERLTLDALAREGRFDLGGDTAFADAATRYGFRSGKSTHENRLDTIRDVFKRHGVMIDTHTADGVKVARELRQPGENVVVLETALPIKFAETIREALGRDPHRPAKFDGIEALPKRVQVMPADTAAVQRYITQHCPAA